MKKTLVILLLIGFMTAGEGLLVDNSPSLRSDQCGNKTGGEDRIDRIPPPGDDSLHGIYTMWKVFLEDMVAPQSLSETLEAIEKNPGFQPVIKYFIGYIIAIVIGLAFAIGVPICGCCFCLCRTLCSCCCRKGKEEGKCAPCKRTAYGVCFFVLSVLLTVGMAFSFLSASFITAQFKATGITSNLANSIEKIDVFMENTVDDLWDFKNDSVDLMLSSVAEQLETFPSNAYTDLGENTCATKEFTKLQIYTGYLSEAKENFETMENGIQNLNANISILNTTLTEWHGNLTMLLSNCKNTKNDIRICEEVKQKTANFEVTLDLKNIQSVKPSIDAIQTASENSTSGLDIITEIKISKSIWSGIGEKIHNVSSDPLQDISGHITKFSTEIEGFMNSTTELTDKVNTEKIQDFLRDDIGPTIERFSPLISFVFMLPCLVPLFIAFFYLLGLLIGVTTGPPGESSKCCHRGRGACSIMCGVGCTYIFTWLVMLLVMVLLVVGGVFHNVLCKQLVAPSESKDIAKLNNMTKIQLNTSMDFLEILENCEQNKAVYTAFQLEKVFPGMNLTEMLDLSKYGFDKILDDIDKLEVFNGKEVPLMSNNTKSHLTLLGQNFTKVDFQSYSDGTKQNITSEPVDTILKFIEAKRDELTNSGNKDTMRIICEELTFIKQQQILPIQFEMDDVADATNEAQSFVESLNITTFIPAMSTAQQNINDKELQGILKSQTSDLLGELDKLTDQIDTAVRCDIGKCKEWLYAADGVVSTVCVFFLYPLNAYWFCLGWCLAMTIPLLTVGVLLVDQYRKESSGGKRNRVAPKAANKRSVPNYKRSQIRLVESNF